MASSLATVPESSLIASVACGSSTSAAGWGGTRMRSDDWPAAVSVAASAGRSNASDAASADATTPVALAPVTAALSRLNESLIGLISSALVARSQHVEVTAAAAPWHWLPVVPSASFLALDGDLRPFAGPFGPEPTKMLPRA